jgi:hypothetical protein
MDVREEASNGVVGVVEVRKRRIESNNIVESVVAGAVSDCRIRR